jgi:hypothetical protein
MKRVFVAIALGAGLAACIKRPLPPAQSPAPVTAPAAATPAPVAPPLATLDLDPKSVAATVRAHASEVQACFEEALMDAGGGAELHGRLDVIATIDASGHVISVWPASTIEAGSRLEACVLRAFRHWIFPPPVDGGERRIKYSFSFE